MPRHLDKYLVKAGDDDDDYQTTDSMKNYFIEVCKRDLDEALQKQKGTSMSKP
jgi:hypothetical protein